jgi:hypothetical protein
MGKGCEVGIVVKGEDLGRRSLDNEGEGTWFQRYLIAARGWVWRMEGIEGCVCCRWVPVGGR